MENDNKELKEETTKKEADKKETESKEETKQPVEETAVQKKKSKKWIGIVAAVVAVILLAYGGVAIYYQSHFLNHTYINNSDCSNMTATEGYADYMEREYAGGSGNEGKRKAEKSKAAVRKSGKNDCRTGKRKQISARRMRAGTARNSGAAGGGKAEG